MWKRCGDEKFVRKKSGKFECFISLYFSQVEAALEKVSMAPIKWYIRHDL